MNQMSDEEFAARAVTLTRGLEERIEEHGFTMVGVFGTVEDPGPPFTYTVGMCRHGLADLITYGLRPETAAQVLGMLCEFSIEQGRDFATGLLPSADWTHGPVMDTSPAVGFASWLLDVDDPDDPAEPMSAARQYADRHRVLLRAKQLLWPDVDGLFPWEGGSLMGQRMRGSR